MSDRASEGAPGVVAHARTREGWAIQSANHRVDLYWNVEDLFDERGMSNPDVVLYTAEGLMDYREDFPLGALLARCADCSTVWEPPTTRSGNLRRADWWLCPAFCNLSEKVAAYLLRQMKDGTRPGDEALAALCRDYLLGLRSPKRMQSWGDLVDVDPLERVADDLQRREEWHTRHSEWTAELDAEFRDFD